MDEADDEITCDTELIDWFGGNTFADLSLGLSQTFTAEVWFPDGEDEGIDDARESVQFAVFFVGTYVTYPTTIRHSVGEILDQVAESVEVQSWQAFEERVQDVEGFPIKASRMPFAPAGTWDDYTLSEYPYRRRLPDSATLARFRSKRLESGRPWFVFDIVNPDGSAAPGQTRLSTMRRRWAGAEPDVPEQADARLLALARQARTFTYLHGTLAP